jgi:hypothetical protein
MAVRCWQIAVPPRFMVIGCPLFRFVEAVAGSLACCDSMGAGHADSGAWPSVGQQVITRQ